MADPAIPFDPANPAAVPTILVVEDDVLVRLVIAEYLRDCGYKVWEASNVAEARSVLAADSPVELVFSDVQMPGNENGFDLAKWIRQHRPGIKVVLTSGLAGAAGNARDVCEDGPLIAKPYEHSAVLHRIQELLAKRAGGSDKV